MIVNVIGGLGNQMFQYAFTYALSNQKKLSAKIDISGFDFYQLRNFELDHFRLDIEKASLEEVNFVKYQSEPIIQKWIRWLFKETHPLATTYYKEPHFQYDPNVFSQSDALYYDGYWQSEKYFKSYRSDLLKQFVIKTELQPITKKYHDLIKNKLAVSLHIRRGDYITDAKTNAFHGTCSLNYYQDAIAWIESKITLPHFFIFSDDLDWSKENLKFISHKTFVELDENCLDHESMWLMSQCQHHIIANSSFSWWGAWLNPNDDKIVIAPKKWFNDPTINTDDLIPEAWVRL